MDATHIIGIVLITFGVSTMVGAGIGFYNGYIKGQRDLTIELNGEYVDDHVDREINKAKKLAAYAYFMGGRN